MTYAEGIKKKRCLERESIMSLVIKIMKERCVIVIKYQDAEMSA